METDLYSRSLLSISQYDNELLLNIDNIVDIIINTCMIPWKSVTPIQSIDIQQKIILILNKIYKIKKPKFNYYYRFINLCCNGNILLAQWVYFKFKKQIKLNKLNVSHNLINFLFGLIQSKNIESIIWIDNLKIISIPQLLLIDALNMSCINSSFEYFNWIINKLLSNNTKSYEILNKTLIKNIKDYNWIEYAQILSKIFPDYIVKISNNRIISSRILDEIDTKIMDDTSYILEKHDDCEICFDNSIYHIKLECKHDYCRNCFFELEKCPMCMRIINKTNVKLIKNM